ncbi:MAG: hypothetical protein U0842_17300 [Candidatus Binatia bacterium]
MTRARGARGRAVGRGCGVGLAGRRLFLVASVALLAVVVRPGRAAADPDSSGHDASSAVATIDAGDTREDIAKDVLNPFSTSVKLTLQSMTGFRIGPRQAVGENLAFQPVVPVPAGEDWTVIVQPLLAGEYLPSPGAVTGLQDFQTSVFLTPAQTGAWVWGAGPILQFPSATDDALGTGKWSGGPTGAVIYSAGPWVNGVLVSHLASFAGDAHRTSVNLTSIEAQLSYTFDSGWYVQTNPTLSYDWQGRAWTIPVGADVGTAFSIGSQAMTVQLGAYDLVARPAGDPSWVLRAEATLVFPVGS